MGAANEVTAAYLNAAFWAAFMLARVASIPIATRVRPRVIMIADLVIALAGILLILFMPSTPAALWGGTVLFGIGIASTFPTLLNFASRHMTITGAVTGWFFVGASLGSMTIPLLIGQTMDRIGPVSLLLVIAGAVSVGLVVFGAMLAHLRSEGGRV
jgi:fucose permease